MQTSLYGPQLASSLDPQGFGLTRKDQGALHLELHCFWTVCLHAVSLSTLVLTYSSKLGTVFQWRRVLRCSSACADAGNSAIAHLMEWHCLCPLHSLW